MPSSTHEPLPDSINVCTGLVIVSGLTVHSELGPGLLESAYRTCLAHELRMRGAHVESELRLPVQFKRAQIDAGYRIDLMVNGAVLVEVKAVAKILPIHSAQLLTYMKLSKCRVGLLINFNVPRLKDGITRLAL